MTTQGHLAIVGRWSSGPARTYRLRRSTDHGQAARNAAYRRLASAMLGLDVATLAAELRAARLSAEPPLAA